MEVKLILQDLLLHRGIPEAPEHLFLPLFLFHQVVQWVPVFRAALGSLCHLVVLSFP